jgi:hypothetical protein
MSQILSAPASRQVAIPQAPPADVPQLVEKSPDHGLITSSRHSITLPRTM